ncbi:MAG: hypothetical protein L7S64_05125 [Longimicrobiales bacterium]|nr:hypothetical protein [Longimicrobiales bacterium]
MIAPHIEVLGTDSDHWRREYAEYRLRQGRELVFLLPPGAVRPLLRRMHRQACPADRLGDDPLTALADYCASLLPLPPLDVWLEDVQRHPEEYLESLDGPGGAPTVSAPATLDARRFERAGTEWVARLRAFRDQDAWRGFISFHARDGAPVQRTSLVFREEGPREVRERFLTFESAALESFLRSAMS